MLESGGRPHWMGCVRAEISEKVRVNRRTVPATDVGALTDAIWDYSAAANAGSFAVERDLGATG